MSSDNLKQHRWMIAVLLTIGFLVMGCIWAAAAPVYAVTEISEISITDIGCPQPGGSPETIQNGQIVTDHITINHMNTFWISNKGQDRSWYKVKDDEKFEAGSLYGVRFVLEPDYGYAFSDAPEVTVNEGNCEIKDQEILEDGTLIFHCVFPQPYMVAGHNTVLYEEQDTASEELAHLTFGDIVGSTSFTMDSWCKVSCNGVVGWVPRSEIAQTYSEKAGHAAYCKVTAGSVNVRSEPDASGDNRVGGLSLDKVVLTTAVTVDSGGNEWYTMDFDGKLAYVMKKYLTETEYPLEKLNIMELPEYITAKENSELTQPQWDRMEVKDEDISLASYDQLTFRVIPSAGSTFDRILQPDIILPSGTGYFVSDFKYDTDEGYLDVFLQNQWTADTGKTLKVQTPALKAGKKKITVKWKKDANASGYFVRYSYDDDMWGASVKLIKNKKTLTTTVKNLKKGKRVYVQVGSYVDHNGSTYNGLMNGPKSVKVK